MHEVLDDLINKQIGENLRSLRKIRGLSQTDLGSLLNVSYQQIQKYEKGTNRLSASNIFNLSKYLEFPLGSFFGKNDEIITTSNYPLETLKVLNDFSKITNQSLRKNLIELIKNIKTLH